MRKKETKPLVVGLGEVLWDVFPEEKRLGGAPSNFAYHAQALGAQSLIVSRVGDDQRGREAMTQLRQAGLNTSYIATDGEHPTGKVTVTVDTEGKPEYVIHEDVAWDHLVFSWEAAMIAPRADAVCFGSLAQRSEDSRRTVQRFLQGVRKNSLRVFDINIRQEYYSEEVLRRSLKVANVLKINDEELPLVARMFSLGQSESDWLQALLSDYELDLIALTRGAGGSLLVSPHERSEHPGYPVEVKDTVGAGDSFTAALVMGLLRRESLDSINDRANRLASYVCTRTGAMPEIPEGIFD